MNPTPSNAIANDVVTEEIPTPIQKRTTLSILDKLKLCFKRSAPPTRTAKARERTTTDPEKKKEIVKWKNLAKSVDTIVIYSMVRFGVSPEINALATVVLLISALIVTIAQRIVKVQDQI